MSTMTSLRRALAATTAAGVAAAGLTLVPGAFAPARAAAGNLELRWEISQQFDDHLSTHVLADGAAEDADGVVTFTGGVSSVVGGLQQVAFEGSVQGSFQPAPGVTAYAITVADPIVTIDGADSAISAEVEAAVGGTVVAPAARVTLTTFDASSATTTHVPEVATLTATPRWAGVLPEGPDSVALGIGAGKPVDGNAWDTELLSHLPSSLRGHFYASGSASDVKKAPAEFSAELPGSALPQVTVAASADLAGATIQVDGSDFVGPVPGPHGVYVVLAKAGGRPGGGSAAEGVANSAAAAWIANTATPGSTGVIESGAFSVSLDVPTAKLDPRQKYSVYTFQAHRVVNDSFDTETPVSIDWAKLGYPFASTATVKVTKKPTTTKKGKVTVDVAGSRFAPTGSVKVVYKGGKLTGKKVKLRTKVALGADGTVKVKLPKSATGKRSIKVTYLGDALHQKSATVKTKVNVRK